LEYDKKNIIHFAIAFLLAVVMFVTIGFAWWVLLLYGALYLLIKSLRIELDERLPWLWTALLFVGGATLSTYSIQYMLLEHSLFVKTSDFKLFLNVLCCLVVYLFIQLFTNNSGRTCAIASITLLFFSFINYFVYLFRQNEFTFSDIRSIGTGLSVAGNYQFRLHDRGVYVILACGLYVALARKCHVSFKKGIWMRVLTASLAILISLIVALNVSGVNTETWEQKGTYRNGYILNFVLSIRDSYIAKPDGYSQEAIAALEEAYSGNGYSDADDNATVPADAENSTDTSADADGTPSKDPTIIVIMNESFSDLGVLGDLQTNIELTPFMDSLTENTIKGYALSSVFGAKTPNSEWEFLTGNTMAFLPSGSVVYQQYIGDTPTSLVSTLKNEGYTCVAMHPYYATGWSRNTVYPTLGYDEMYFLDDFDQSRVIRDYISDEELYDKIIERYEDSGTREKLYIMGITMQNHGGYTQSYGNFPEMVYKIGQSYTDANQYLSLVHESDKALEKLITYFAGVTDPVEIVFFGDHQPSLTSDFYPLLNGKGLSGLSEDELETLYTVPFFIWTNYESKAEEVEMTSLNFLSTMALERAGIALPAYNQFLHDLQEVVPAINSRGYYSKTNGSYLHVDNAVGEEAKWINQYRILQYNSMFDETGRSNLFFPYLK
jgi:phosphoglycerol transferase MdoB-like AlkP superfamily enzyme